MDNDEFIHQVASLAEKWNKAEKWVKKGENINSEVVTPSINELRYAGRRIIDAFDFYKNGDKEKTKANLVAAEDCLNKAKHDALDAIYTFIAEEAGQLQDTVGAPALQEYFPNYAPLFALIDDMSEKIELSREHREQRDTLYNKLFKDLPKLEKLFKELKISIDKIQVTIEEKSKKESRNKMRTYLLWFLSLIIVFSLGIFTK